MKKNKKLKWENPSIEILTHEKIMGKENLPVSETNKTATTSITVQASTS